MARSHGRHRNLVFTLAKLSQAATFETSSTVPRSSHNIFQRGQLSCPAGNSTSCPPSVPFCCPPTSTCISLTPDNSSVICCPEGKDCSIIQPISCDLRLQNANKYPEQVLHSNRRHGKLPRCGTACCPFGYECQGDNCTIKHKNHKNTKVMGKNHSSHGKHGNTSEKPVKSTTSEPPIIPAATTSSDASLPVQTSKAGAASGAEVSNSPSSSTEFPAKAVVLGLFIGLIISIALGSIVWLILRRRKQRKSGSEAKEGPEDSHTPRYITNPVVSTQYGHRTDFLMASPERSGRSQELESSPLRHALPSSAVAPRRPRRSDELQATAEQEDEFRQQLNRVGTDDSYITTGSSDYGASPPERGGSVRSKETISVKLMPPPPIKGRTRGVSTNTTWSTMMELGGMKKAAAGRENPYRWSNSNQ